MVGWIKINWVSNHFNLFIYAKKSQQLTCLTEHTFFMIIYKNNQMSCLLGNDTS